MRISLDIPEHLPFETELRVRVTDLNYGNHLGNDRLLAYLHEARVRWLSVAGLSELEDESGVGFVQTDSVILYKAEGFLGDRVRIRVGTSDWSSRSWDFLYRLTLPDQDDRVMALAKTGMLAFHYPTRKVTTIPAHWREVLDLGTERC